MKDRSSCTSCSANWGIECMLLTTSMKERTLSVERWKMKYNPLEYMRTAIKFVISHASAGLFLDPGLGKTAIIYAAFKILRQTNNVRSMLVIAPLRPAQSTWPAEARKWD